MVNVHNHSDMRAEIVKYVRINRDLFTFNNALNEEQYCDAPDHVSADEWADTMQHNTVFGDNMCILAASRIFRVMIVLKSMSLRPDGTMASGCENFGGEFNKEENGYIALVLQDQHYFLPSLTSD